MNDDFAALQEVRALRVQIKDRQAKATAATADTITALDQKGAALEGDFTRLNGELASILEVLEESDQTPTSQAAAAVANLRKALDVALARWKSLKAELAPLTK